MPFLCRKRGWSQDPPPDIDSDLAAQIAAIEKVPPEARPAAPAKPSAGEGEEAESTLDDRSHLLRDCLLWHTVALLHAWRSRTALSGPSRGDIEALRARLKKVTDLDPHMGDPLLIEGLKDEAPPPPIPRRSTRSGSGASTIS